MPAVKILLRYRRYLCNRLQILLQARARILFTQGCRVDIASLGRSGGTRRPEHHRVDDIPPAEQTFIASQYHVHPFAASLMIDKIKVDLVPLLLKRLQFAHHLETDPNGGTAYIDCARGQAILERRQIRVCFDINELVERGILKIHLADSAGNAVKLFTVFLKVGPNCCTDEPIYLDD